MILSDAGPCRGGSDYFDLIRDVSVCAALSPLCSRASFVPQAQCLLERLQLSVGSSEQQQARSNDKLLQLLSARVDRRCTGRRSNEREVQCFVRSPKYWPESTLSLKLLSASRNGRPGQRSHPASLDAASARQAECSPARFSSSEGLLPLPRAEGLASLLQVDLEEEGHQCEDLRCAQLLFVFASTCCNLRCSR